MTQSKISYPLEFSVFIKQAKKAECWRDLFNEMAHTKNISIETSNWFRAEYDKNENLTGKQCVELFFNDVKNGAYGTKKLNLGKTIRSINIIKNDVMAYGYL